MTESSLIHLRRGGVSLVIDVDPHAMPSIVHWGPDLGEATEADLRALRAATRPLPDNIVDAPERVSIVPESARGWLGTPGLQGSRDDGTGWSPRFGAVLHDLDDETLVSRGHESLAGLQLETSLSLEDSGLLRARAVLTNNGRSSYYLNRLVIALPVPAGVHEMLDQTGRWSKERVPQRREIAFGVHARESRRGRTGADAATVLIAGERGFGFQHGRTWGLHVGWSGNHVSYLERHNNGRTVLGGGELLMPGEIALAPGGSYSTPWIYAAYGDGLDEQAGRLHSWLRQRPRHPSAERPVTLNVWEAVYFQHDLGTLSELVDRAADIGVERFVLDDGWFRGRRNDDAGLGDWYVDENVWPAGLWPLVERVRARGMQFGLWFEPEMVNLDSDLAREHPEWIMQTEGRMPPEARNQQVLNVAIPDAKAYLLERISTLIDEYAIDYLKWDHNRDLIEAGSTSRGGAAAVHEQTRAVYALMDEIALRHPGLEIESCSSGGARVDLGILEHTDRVWASDCIDPLERQQILRWTSQLLPPELVGSHVAGPHSHTTGRTHGLGFRAVTALFGHFGVEWDLTAATVSERAELAEWIAVYKHLRPLIATGSVVRVDGTEHVVQGSGVIARDGSEALFEIAMLGRPTAWPPGVIRVPGLAPEGRYRVKPLGPGSTRHDRSAPVWQRDGGCVLTGRMLGEIGVQVPLLQPEQAVLVSIVRE